MKVYNNIISIRARIKFVILPLIKLHIVMLSNFLATGEVQNIHVRLYYGWIGYMQLALT